MTTIHKTVGRSREDGDKDYEIHTTDGDVFQVVKSGSKWLAGGKKFPSIKAVKAAIIAGIVDVEEFEEDEDEDDSVRWFDDDETVDVVETRYKNLWDCCAPAALLALVFRDGFTTELRAETMKTLDSLGLIRPDGSVDYVSALRELSRSKKEK